MKRLLIVLAPVALILTGCMVARGPMGEIVMGVDLGAMPESASEVGGALASLFLGPVAGGHVATVLATLLGGGSIAVAGRKIATKEHARKKADQGREKANAEALALRAILKATGVIKPVEEDPVDPSP